MDVNAEGQGVETTRTSISSTVDERRVINLPTNGRNFLDFATLTPGIVRDPTRSGDLAVGGQKGTLNSLQIDGTSSDNTFFGQSSGRIGSGRARRGGSRAYGRLRPRRRRGYRARTRGRVRRGRPKAEIGRSRASE